MVGLEREKYCEVNTDWLTGIKNTAASKTPVKRTAPITAMVEAVKTVPIKPPMLAAAPAPQRTSMPERMAPPNELSKPIIWAPKKVITTGVPKVQRLTQISVEIPKTPAKGLVTQPSNIPPHDQAAILGMALSAPRPKATPPIVSTPKL